MFWKNKFKNALYQFIIWTILLVIVFFYLQDNQAERVSILSWPAVLYDNIKIFVVSMFSERWEYLRERHSLERTFNELVLSVESSGCFDVEKIRELKEKQEELESLTMEEFQEEYMEIREYIRWISEKLNTKCNAD